MLKSLSLQQATVCAVKLQSLPPSPFHPTHVCCSCPIAGLMRAGPHTHTCVSDYAFVNIWCLTRGLATIWKRDWDISTVPWVYSGRITVWYCTCSVHARFSDSTLLFSGIVSLRNSYMCSFSTSPTPHPLFSGNPTQAVPGQQPPE